MKALIKMIEEYGIGIGDNMIKVDSFLNHRIDTKLMCEMGEVLAEHFANTKPDLILTIESSGIALAVATAHALGNVPVIFAKKASKLSEFFTIAKAEVCSYTRKDIKYVGVERKYIPCDSRILIIDDFLANGNAAMALVSIAEQTCAQVVGVGVAIEKNFERGGKRLREQGINVFSLAQVEAIIEGKIICKK